MHVSEAASKQAYFRALIWLVDERAGVAPIVDLAKCIVGNYRGGPTWAILTALERNGWVKLSGIIEGKNFMRGTVSATFAGWKFRHYMKTRHLYYRLSRQELTARIEGLELALEPFADLGRSIRAGDRPMLKMQLDSIGISPLRAEIAACVMDKDDNGVIYPWTPGTLRAN